MDKKFGMDKKLVKSALVGLVAFAGGTIVVTQLGSAVTGFGSARRDSVAVRNELAEDTERTATELSQSQAITVEGLTPGAQIVDRCSRGTLLSLPVVVPGGVSVLPPDVTKVCPAALLEELQEEQEELNKFAGLLAEARSLARRMEDQLEESEPARGWKAVVSGFGELHNLETSDHCNEVRDHLVELLRSPKNADPVGDRDALLDERVMHLRDGDESKPSDQQKIVSSTIADGLIGPRTAGSRCDRHGNAFIPASRRVRLALVDESSKVAGQIRRSHAKLLNDKTSDVVGSLVNFWYIAGLVVAIVAWLLSRRIKDDPDKPILVTIVPEASHTDPDRGQ